MKEDEFTREIALFQNKYGYISEWRSDWDNDDYVRISEPVTVTYKPLDRDEVLKARVKALDNEIKAVRAEAENKINDLKDQKQRLMAITCEES